MNANQDPEIKAETQGRGVAEKIEQQNSTVKLVWLLTAGC
jgi:hypothetical protein